MSSRGAVIFPGDGVTATEFRVRYAETDQMGVAHHAHYLVWCETARTDHMRQRGVSYRDLEAQGVRLPVVEASIRYRAAARYDDVVRVRCWVRDTGSRRVVFGYAIDRPEDQRLLATAQTALVAVDSNHDVTTIPQAIRAKLIPIHDPITS